MRDQATSCGVPNSATTFDQGFYPPRSYSLMSPPRTSRHLIGSWEGSAMGSPGRLLLGIDEPNPQTRCPGISNLPQVPLSASLELCCSFTAPAGGVSLDG